MIPRKLTIALSNAADEFLVVTLLGARQVGKTTVCKAVFSEKPYFSLENPDTRRIIAEDPRSFLSELTGGAVLDEIQNFPTLLSYIQEIVDDSQKNGMFILTGSHQPEVQQAVGQSLAGRTAILRLDPFSLEELEDVGVHENYFEWIQKGFYPGLYQKIRNVSLFYSSYIQTYIERDIRKLLQLKDLDQFQNFITLLAGRVGQVLNYSSISSDLGISSVTVKNWIRLLKVSFIVIELKPWFGNIRRQIVKSPKLYFTDTGLLCHLLGIENAQQLKRDPLRGGIYENFVLMELRKQFHQRGEQPEFFFFRDAKGHEVDLLIRKHRKLIPIEITSSETYHSDFLKGIHYFRKIEKECSEQAYVIYNGEMESKLHGIQLKNLFKNSKLNTDS